MPVGESADLEDPPLAVRLQFFADARWRRLSPVRLSLPPFVRSEVRTREREWAADVLPPLILETRVDVLERFRVPAIHRLDVHHREMFAHVVVGEGVDRIHSLSDALLQLDDGSLALRGPPEVLQLRVLRANHVVVARNRRLGVVGRAGDRH